MEVMATTHPEGGPGKYYMVVAEAGEWEQVIVDLDLAGPHKLYPATEEMVEGLKSWGLEAK